MGSQLILDLYVTFSNCTVLYFLSLPVVLKNFPTLFPLLSPDKASVVVYVYLSCIFPDSTNTAFPGFSFF